MVMKCHLFTPKCRLHNTRMFVLYSVLKQNTPSIFTI